MMKLSAWKRGVFGLIALITVLNSWAQDGYRKVPNVNVMPNCQGYVQYLPTGYTASPNNKYPIIIYFTGLGNHGDGSESGLNTLFSGGGIPAEQARNGDWVESYTVNGQTFKFITFTPQFVRNMASDGGMVRPGEVDTLISYAISTFHVDTSRIYLVGASQGGGIVWDYVGAKSAYAKRVAAIAPFGGVAFPFPVKSNRMKWGNVKVWAFHSAFDELVPYTFSRDFVKFYNSTPNVGVPPARLTSFPSTAHLCWFEPLMRTYTENGLNVYQWLLQYRQEPTTAFAGEDQELTASQSSASLTATGKAPNGTESSHKWSKLYGPVSAATFSTPNAASTTVSGLAQGSYVFQHTITGTDGSTATDYVAVTVNPPETAIEAESYTAVTGSFSVPSPINGVTRLDGIESGDVFRYTVSVPAAGIYQLRIPTGSRFGGGKFSVKSLSGTITDEANVYSTGSFDQVYQDNFLTIDLVTGSQILEFRAGSVNPQSAGNTWYMDKFFIISNTPALYPLPLTFSLVNANCINNAVELSWKTAGESNTKQFSIEKSADGRNWTTLGNAAVSPTESYNYHDASTTPGSFYRIVEEAQDGRKTYSSVITGSCAAQSSFKVYPNPVVNQTVISVSLPQLTKLDLRLTDAKGAIVIKQVHTLPQGNNQLSLNLARLPSGIYTLTANWEGNTRSMQIVKN